MSEHLDMNLEETVRIGAYYLWEQDGRPFGREIEHWTASEEAISREMTAAPAAEEVIAAPAPVAPAPFKAAAPAPAMLAAKPKAKAKAAPSKKVAAKRMVAHAMEHASLQ